MTMNWQRLSLLTTTALTALALASAFPAAGPARAQDATWLANPGSGDFFDANNWNPGSVPTGTATFGASSTTTLTLGTNGNFGGWTFDAGAANYTFNVAPSVLQQFTGTGITINGGSATIVSTGSLNFTGTSTAGNATITNNDIGGGTNVYFRETSTAGNATITNNDGLTFFDTGTAGSATIANNDSMAFLNASTAGNATITNSNTLVFIHTSTAGNATIVNDYSLIFGHTSTAGSATITNNTSLIFSDTSTAGSATITNNNSLAFSGTSTAGSATITIANASILVFNDNSTAGNAALVNDAGGFVSFAGSGPAGDGRLSAGSIAGAGNYVLGANELTVGSNNLSTAVSGVISGTGGSLVKVGTGTLTLTGTNTHTGGTTISGGLVNFAALSNFGTGNVTLNGGGVQWAANTTTDISSRLAALGASGGTFDTNGNNVTLATGISGTGSLTKTGSGTLILTGTNTYAGGTTISGDTLQIGDGSATGSILGGVTVHGTFDIVTADTSGITTISNNGSTNFRNATSAASATIANSNTLHFLDTSTAGSATITNTNNGTVFFFDNSTAGSATITNNGQSVNFLNASTAGSATITNNNFLYFFGTSTAGSATIANNHFWSFNNTSTAGSATIVNNGFLGFSGTSTAANAIITNNSGLGFAETSTAGNATITNNHTLDFSDTSTAGNAALVNNLGGVVRFANSSGPTGDGRLSAGSIAGAGSYVLGANELTVGSTNLSTAVSGVISGTGGSLVKVGTGVLTLTGTNTYTGGTTVSGGLVNFAALDNFGTGNVTLNGGGVQWAAGTTTDISGRLAALGASGGTFDTNGNNVTLATGISGAGSLTKAGLGLLTLAGNNTYTGGTFVTGGTLAVTGSVAGAVGVSGGLMSFNGNSSGAAVTLSGSGIVGGTGTIGSLNVTGGTVAPGNSIGTLNVVGPFVQNGGVYEVEVNAAGLSDRINVTGTATINGGTVSVVAEQGNYARNTSYTILSATGGRTGAYTSVTSNFAFLTPTLSYDANNVFLNLALRQSAFASGAQTPNQAAVGRALDIAEPGATGDFATVIEALAGLNTLQGPAALNAISGQNYAGFASGLVQTGQMFMSNFAAQAGGANRVGGVGVAGRGSRVELAEACDVACGPAGLGTWSMWGGAVGATGSLAGNGNAGTMTYSAGGFAAGIDRKITEDLLVGFTLGYASGTQWSSGFSGRGTADTVQAGLYAGFLKGPFYVDGLVGYAYSANRMTREIAIPGLATRVATGSTGANQFFGQVETGYRIGIGGMADAYVVPFLRLQGSTSTQDGFTESGAGSLNLTVASQTTNSLRSVIGAQIGGAIDLGWREKLAVQLKLGWSHEFASTDRPVTAAFAGAPAVPFTTFGAAPERDGVVVGFNAGTAIAERTSVYFRYEGEFSGQGNNTHAVSVGLRMTW